MSSNRSRRRRQERSFAQNEIDHVSDPNPEDKERLQEACRTCRNVSRDVWQHSSWKERTAEFLSEPYKLFLLEFAAELSRSKLSSCITEDRASRRIDRAMGLASTDVFVNEHHEPDQSEGDTGDSRAQAPAASERSTHPGACQGHARTREPGLYTLRLALFHEGQNLGRSECFIGEDLARSLADRFVEAGQRRLGALLLTSMATYLAQDAKRETVTLPHRAHMSAAAGHYEGDGR